MSNTANYLIVQHMSDVFRREPRNIGVFVRRNGETNAKFFGEMESGQIDRRKIKVLPFPDVYSQWVDYWRRTLTRHPAKAWDEVRENTRDHYHILDGGSLDGIGEDSIQDVTNFLYSALVSEGGIALALGAPTETQAVVKLSESIEDELRDRQILLEDDRSVFQQNIKSPVRKNIPVEGATAYHTISFYQRSILDTLFEPIDITVKRDRKGMEERAGWASRVFGDIKEKKKDTEAVTIIDATAAEEKEASAVYALKLLRPFSRILNWQSQSDREAFLVSLQELAMTG